MKLIVPPLHLELDLETDNLSLEEVFNEVSKIAKDEKISDFYILANYDSDGVIMDISITLINLEGN